MKVTLYVLAGCEGIKKIMKVNDHKFMVTPICILVLIVALTMFDDIMDSITELTYYNYIAVLMQGIIPVMIAIISIIQLKIMKKKFLDGKILHKILLEIISHRLVNIGGYGIITLRFTSHKMYNRIWGSQWKRAIQIKCENYICLWVIHYLFYI